MNPENTLGRFTFVLHSHLPYVLSHGRWPHGMEWLHEAAAETYIPLLRVFRKLHGEGVRLAVTLGITPVLAEQLADPTFKEDFPAYLQRKREAAEKDAERFAAEGRENLAAVARFWVDTYRDLERDYEEWNRDLIGQFAELQEAGAIEIITCAATHGYLPLLGTDEAVEAQIRVGVETYRKHFGRDPKGIWLPECAYRPGYHWVSPAEPEREGFDRKGIEYFLQKYGIRFFIVDTHLLKGGKAIGVYLDRFEGLQQLWDQASAETRERVREEDIEKTPYRVYWIDKTPGRGDPVGILTRDPTTSLQVWSGEWGYPGDGNYLDFHKKHFPGGHRYWRVTRAQADLGEKEEYVLGKIDGRLEENSDHFVNLLAGVLRENDTIPPAQRLVVSPFDTELFGHWWFEGPGWLERVLRKVHETPGILPATGGEMIEHAGQAPVVALPEGSWGEGGFHYIWYNSETEWTWPIIHKAEREMTRLAREHGDAGGEAGRVLRQLAREL
ncbi:MAG TPA: DUF1957 domain-containing protein, partial [Bacteroidetes bacterium]|nr:DUF1957 domain-containing protein [Bacteroidota bacterium]